MLTWPCTHRRLWGPYVPSWFRVWGLTVQVNPAHGTLNLRQGCACMWPKTRAKLFEAPSAVVRTLTKKNFTRSEKPHQSQPVEVLELLPEVRVQDLSDCQRAGYPFIKEDCLNSSDSVRYRYTMICLNISMTPRPNDSRCMSIKVCLSLQIEMALLILKQAGFWVLR